MHLNISNVLICVYSFQGDQFKIDNKINIVNLNIQWNIIKTWKNRLKHMGKGESLDMRRNIIKAQQQANSQHEYDKLRSILDQSMT